MLFYRLYICLYFSFRSWKTGRSSAQKFSRTEAGPMKYQQWNIATRPEEPYKAMRERGVPILVASTLCARLLF